MVQPKIVNSLPSQIHSANLCCCCCCYSCTHTHTRAHLIIVDHSARDQKLLITNHLMLLLHLHIFLCFYRVLWTKLTNNYFYMSSIVPFHKSFLSLSVKSLFDARSKMITISLSLFLWIFSFMCFFFPFFQLVYAFIILMCFRNRILPIGRSLTDRMRSLAHLSICVFFLAVDIICVCICPVQAEQTNQASEI